MESFGTATSIHLNVPLRTLILESIRGTANQTAVKPAAPTRPATEDAIQQCSKEIDIELRKYWEEFEGRKEAQNLGDFSEVTLARWFMGYIWDQPYIGNIAHQEHNPVNGADPLHVLEFTNEGLKLVVFVQFKVKHADGVNFTRKKPDGAQLEVLVKAANNARAKHSSDTLVFAVFAVFTEQGLKAWAVEEIIRQYAHTDPESTEMDATIAKRKAGTAHLMQHFPNPDGFLAEILHLGLSRADAILTAEPSGAPS
ncbi:hypothetical protein FRC17_003416, partial [Serendipita sp. 399]